MKLIAVRGGGSAGIVVLAWFLLGPGSLSLQASPQSLDAIPTLVMFTPSSVEVDVDQTLWISDRYLPRIVHARPDGSPLSLFSTSRFSGGPPAGVTLASGSGYLFISDPQFQRIVRVDFAGNAAGEFGTSALGITNPADLAFDSRDGTLFVADPTARAIFHLAIQDADLDGNPDGASLVDSIGTVPLGLDNPMGIALDPASGHLYVSDPALDRVFEVALPGTIISSFDTGFYGGTSVTGLAWESAPSRLRMADAGRKILSLSSAGAPLGRIGTAPFGSLSPQGIAWDPSSSTFLVVSGERKLLQFQPETPDAEGTVGGIYLWRQEWTSAFTSIAPSGITLDVAGIDRFVVDGGQDRVFRVNPMGVAMNSFGTAGAGNTAPTGVAQGPGGTSLYLTDNAARKVFQFGLSGTPMGDFSTSPFKHKPQSEPPCDNPVGIAYDSTRDHFFVADYQARVFEVTRTGSFVASFSTAPAAPYPTDLAVDPAGDRVIVCDSTGSYAEFTRSGAFLASYPGVPLHVRGAGAEGVSVDRATLHRILHDPAQNSVLILHPAGPALGQISLEPYGIQSPSGAVWSSASSRLYVADRVTQRFHAITAGPDGDFGNADDTNSWVPTPTVGSLSPAGALLDEAQGKVGWVDEQTARLYWVTPGLLPLGSLDLAPAGATAPRGADQDPTSTHLFTSDPSAGLIRTDASGGMLEATPWGNLGIVNPGAIGLSPAEGLLLAVDRASHNLVQVDLQGYFLAEIQGVGFPDDSHLVWNPNAVFSGYRVIRGLLSNLASGSYGACFWQGPGPSAPVAEVPAEGDGWLYLVAGENTTGVGTLGSRSDGTPRPSGPALPACP